MSEVIQIRTAGAAGRIKFDFTEHSRVGGRQAKDAAAKQRYRQMAKHTMEEGTAAARRLQMSADNAADSYARAMRKATEAAMTPKAAPAKPTAKSKTKAKTGKAKKGKAKT